MFLEKVDHGLLKCSASICLRKFARKATFLSGPHDMTTIKFEKIGFRITRNRYGLQQ